MVTDPSFNFVCQMGHWLASAFVTLAAVHLFGPEVEGPVILIGVTLAAVKEFWYDLHYESPQVSGGAAGGREDFAFYGLGFVVAAIVLAL